MADDPLDVFDASDPVAVNNARRDEERRAREDLDVLRAIMHTKKGRAFIVRQLDRCHVNSPAKFVAGSADATAHNLGRESYGLLLLQDVMAASVDLYMTAIKEAQDEIARTAAVQREQRKKREEAERGNSIDAMIDLPPPSQPRKPKKA